MLAGTAETMQVLVNITGCKLLLQDDRRRTSFQISKQSMPQTTTKNFLCITHTVEHLKKKKKTQTMANVQFNILVSIIQSQTRFEVIVF